MIAAQTLRVEKRHPENRHPGRTLALQRKGAREVTL